MLHRLYNWTMGLAAHPQALSWLALISFIESSIFPIPPDVLLVAMVLAARDKAILHASVCTIASVVGGWLGYAIGFYLFEAIGQPILELYHYTEQFKTFQQTFNEYGAWIVLIKGLTPIPYKLITITAGVTHLDLMVFTLASIASRGMRFFLVAGLLWKFGPPIRTFIEQYLTLVTTVFVLLLIGGVLLVKFI
jgi:membrane protein YqaA with SNARE-associated domain